MLPSNDSSHQDVPSSGQDDTIVIGGSQVERKQQRNRRRRLTINMPTAEEERQFQDSTVEPITGGLMSAGDRPPVHDVEAATSWEHQDHPADVIVHSWGNCLCEALESIISGTTAVMMEDPKTVRPLALTASAFDAFALEDIDSSNRRLSIGQDSYSVIPSDNQTPIDFVFQAPTLSGLVHKVLQCGVLYLYGNLNYTVIRRGIVRSFTYVCPRRLVNMSDSIDVMTRLCPQGDSENGWGDEVNILDDDRNAEHCDTGYFQVVIHFYGEPYDPRRHPAATEIKAITRHDARVVCHDSEADECLLGQDEEAISRWHFYVVVDI